MPGVAVACRGRPHSRGAVVYGQVQRDGAVAARRVGGRVCGSVGGSGVGGTVPGVAVAGGNGLSGGVAMVYREVQCDGAVATSLCGQRQDGSVGRSGVCVAMPCQTVASHYHVGKVIGGEDVELQGNNRVAPLRGVERVDIGARGGQRL